MVEAHFRLPRQMVVQRPAVTLLGPFFDRPDAVRSVLGFWRESCDGLVRLSGSSQVCDDSLLYRVPASEVLGRPANGRILVLQLIFIPPGSRPNCIVNDSCPQFDESAKIIAHRSLKTFCADQI